MDKKQFFLLLFFCIFTFLSLFFVLRKNFLSLPSSNWSRSLNLKTFDIDYDFNKTKSDNVFCEFYDDKIYILISEDNGLNFLVYDSNGKELMSKILRNNTYFNIVKGNIFKRIPIKYNWVLRYKHNKGTEIFYFTLE